MENKKNNYFNLGDVNIPYTLSNGKKSKNIRLTIDIDGLRVTKPYRTKLDEVEKLMNSKSNWILKHFNNFQSIKLKQYNRNWKNGETILYCGENYNIKICEHQESMTIVEFNGKMFEIFVDNNLSEDDRKISIENEFRKWFRIIALKTIKDRVEHYSKVTGLTYNSIKIKEQKTRWGSCSRKGNLNFNWKIIMSPPWVMDYVVLHEVCHLKHLNHSNNYWNMVDIYMPNYKEAYDWLKKNGISLRL